MFLKHGQIVCGNDERDTHYYITRGRVGAPGRNVHGRKKEQGAG
jgi:hypothetical protein